MDNTLTFLIDSLRSALKVLKGDVNTQLMAELHNHDRLPNKQMAALASQAVDLLHEIEQLLEPGPLVLADHFLGYLNSKCLCAAVELNVPDILDAGPRTLSDLSIACDARRDRLGQVLRVLYNNGIFSYDSSTNTYRNNTTSNLLLSDHWTQWRNWVNLYGNEFYDMARGIPAACHKSSTRMPAQINFDTDLDMFTFFTQQGWLPRLHNTLSGGAIAQAPGLLEDYPWGEIADCTFLDVGGGGGGLVALLLRKFPNMQAGILDLSKVIEHARTNFHAPNGQYTDVGPRVSSENLIAGDFLVSVPSFEVYTMKWCLHDWDDSKSLTVMRNIRDAIRKEPKSRLVILESLLTDGRMGRLSRYGDIMMMVSANGQERSEAEWMSLAERTGWKINRICPLRNSWPSAIELVPNWDSAPDTKGLTCSNGSLEAEETTVTAEPQATNGVNGSVTNRDVVAKGPSTISEMSYLEPWDASRAQPFFRAAPDAGFESTNFRWMDYSVVVTDARPCKNDFSLDVQGFSFVEDPEGLTAELSNALRLNDNENVKKEYYPRIDSMVKRATGASRVIIFDHTLRRRNPSMDSKQNSNGQEQPATVVHCDQSSKGALRRLRENISEGEDIYTVLQNRVQIINVWRPLRGPVEDWPLAVMDYRSLSPSNIHPCDIWRGQYEYRGQTVAFSHTDGHKWYYLDRHRTDEVTMIKIWDSKEDVVGKRTYSDELSTFFGWN